MVCVIHARGRVGSDDVSVSASPWSCAASGLIYVFRVLRGPLCVVLPLTVGVACAPILRAPLALQGGFVKWWGVWWCQAGDVGGEGC